MITPGIEDVIADAKRHGVSGTGEHSMVLNMARSIPRRMVCCAW